MGKIGVIKPNEHVELIDGELYSIPPLGSQHAAWVDRVARALEKACSDEVIIRVQSPVRLDEHSAPEPDVSVLKFQADFYEAELPGPNDVLLAVEVSRSTLKHDRHIKLAAYAASGIPEVWLINLVEKRVEVYLRPLGREYRSRTLHTLDETLLPTAVPNGQEVVF